MSNLWKKVELNDGEPVVYLGVYVTRWQSSWGEPTVGFVQADEDDNAILLTRATKAEADNVALKSMVERLIEAGENLMDEAEVRLIEPSTSDVLIQWDTLVSEAKEQK